MSSSAVSNIPLWGQAYKLTVTYATPGGGSEQVVLTSNSWEPEALRMTFDVLQAMISSPFWYADISVYNLTAQAQQNALLNATWVTLEAGFQTGPSKSAIIWDGPVLQTIVTREEVVDQVISFHCVANPLFMNDIVSFSMGPFSAQQHLLAGIARQVGAPEMSTNAGTLSSYAQQQLTAKQYLRGNTVFGKYSRYLHQIADDNFMQTWRDGSRTYISEVSTGQTNLDPNYVYAPTQLPLSQQSQLPDSATQSLLGTPRQIPYGAEFMVLLDPRLKVQLPPLVVELQFTSLSLLTVRIGGEAIVPLTNLKFFVAQVRHLGDTRGNDWQTEVTGYSTTYAQQLLDGLFTANAAGG